MSPRLTRSFDYSWTAFNQSACAINWVALTTSETTYHHARLHQLRKDDSLSYFMATLSSIPAARAMVLINYENSLEISGENPTKARTPGGRQGGDWCPPVPVVMVTGETGAELMKLVTDYPRCVDIKVELSPSIAKETTSSQSSFSTIASRLLPGHSYSGHSKVRTPHLAPKWPTHTLYKLNHRSGDRFWTL